MKSRLHILGTVTLGVILALAGLGAVYNQFSPGGALSGTWNSQNVNVAAGAPFITGTLPAGNGGTGSAFTQFAGPNTTVKTLTLPNANATLLSDANAVTLAQGGTGLTSAADDTALVSSGAAWVATALPSCTDTGGNHLNYDTSTNAFLCGTSGSGTSGTFTITWDDACTTSPTNAVAWRQSNSTVTWEIKAASGTCTSDSTTVATTTAIVPASIRPANQQIIAGIFNVNNGGTALLSCVIIKTDGTVQLTSPGTACPSNITNWTNTGTKSFNSGLVTSLAYSLDP